MDDKAVVKRTAKDSIFTHLFQDRRYVLQLYRVLHPEAAAETIRICKVRDILRDYLSYDSLV